jgi:hypothetical protein
MYKIEFLRNSNKQTFADLIFLFNLMEIKP